MTPDVLEETIRLREHQVLVLPYRQVHLVERTKLFGRVGRADNHAMALGLVNRPVRRVMESTPDVVEIRPEIQSVPFRPLDDAESGILTSQIVVQTAYGSGTIVGQMIGGQDVPHSSVVDERIAVVRERQRDDAIAEQVAHMAEGQAANGYSVAIERQAGL